MDIKEKKRPQPPKKSLLFYYGIVFLILIVLNLFVGPYLQERSIKEVSYDEFLDDLEAGKISEVNLDDNVIYYLEKGAGKKEKIRFIKQGVLQTGRK